MTIIAKFSNGFEDKYNGNRDVKAAWMITRKDTGEVLMSGHSLDRAKAAKTASGNLRYLASAAGVDMPAFDVPRTLHVGANYSWMFKAAAKHGFTGGSKMHAYKVWAAAKNAERRAAIEAAISIEVVDV